MHCLGFWRDKMLPFLMYLFSFPLGCTQQKTVISEHKRLNGRPLPHKCLHSNAYPYPWYRKSCCVNDAIGLSNGIVWTSTATKCAKLSNPSRIGRRVCDQGPPSVFSHIHSAQWKYQCRAEKIDKCLCTEHLRYEVYKHLIM